MTTENTIIGQKSQVSVKYGNKDTADNLFGG